MSVSFYSNGLSLGNGKQLAETYGALMEKEAQHLGDIDCERIAALFGRTFLENPTEPLDVWIEGLILKNESRLSAALSCLQKIGMQRFVPYLGLFSLNETDRYLLVDRYCDESVFVTGNIPDLKPFDLRESQRFALALRYGKERSLTALCFEMDKFQLTNERKRTELILRLANNSSEIKTAVRDLKITDQDLLFKIFLIGISRDPKFALGWKVAFSDSAHQGFCKILQRIQGGQDLSYSICSSIQYESLFVQKWAIKEVISPYLQTIEKMEEEKWRIDALSWLTRLMVSCLLEGVPPAEALAHPFTESALEHRDPKMREALIFKIASFLSDRRLKKYGNQCLDQEEFPKYARLPVLLISLFLGSTDAPLELCDPLVKFSRERAFKNAKNLKVYLNALMLILEEPSWSQKDKHYLLELIVPKELDPATASSIKAAVSLLQILPAVYGFGAHLLKIENLKIQNNDVGQILFEEFHQQIPIRHKELLDQFYPELKEKFRIPDSLLIYAGKLNEIREQDEGAQLKSAFASFVDALLEDLEKPQRESYRKMRYSLERSVHLEEVFSTRPKLFAKWQENEVVPLTEFIESSSFLSKMKDSNLLEYEQLLSSCKGWTIGITDDPVDLYLCGTETPSCQTIHYPIGDNRGLLAGPLDGKNKIVEIKTTDGTIVARRLLQVLYNEQKEPVLLMGPLYRQPAFRSLLKGVLELFALQRAEKLELPLLVSIYEKAPPDRKHLTKQYEGSIFSLGSSVPCEYVDSLTTSPVGALKRGAFEIEISYYY